MQALRLITTEFTTKIFGEKECKLAKIMPLNDNTLSKTENESVYEEHSKIETQQHILYLFNLLEQVFGVKEQPHEVDVCDHHIAIDIWDEEEQDGPLHLMDPRYLYSRK